MQALVLEFLKRPMLADRIARGPVPLDEALAIARQVTKRDPQTNKAREMMEAFIARQLKR